MKEDIRIFSYLPNPRVWKSLITAKLISINVNVIGDKPRNLPEWLWDFDARKLNDIDVKDLTKFNDGIIVTLGSLNSLAGDLFKNDRHVDVLMKMT